MGKIVSDFESLPAESAKGARSAYAGVLADLMRLGLPVPAGKTAEDISREELKEHLQTVSGDLLGRYLAADPDGIAKEAKTDDELAAKVSERLAAVWGGVPFTPNAVTAEDVAAARMMGG